MGCISIEEDKVSSEVGRKTKNHKRVDGQDKAIFSFKEVNCEPIKIGADHELQKLIKKPNRFLS